MTDEFELSPHALPVTLFNSECTISSMAGDADLLKKRDRGRRLSGLENKCFNHDNKKRHIKS